MNQSCSPILAGVSGLIASAGVAAAGLAFLVKSLRAGRPAPMNLLQSNMPRTPVPFKVANRSVGIHRDGVIATSTHRWPMLTRSSGWESQHTPRFGCVKQVPCRLRVPKAQGSSWQPSIESILVSRPPLQTNRSRPSSLVVQEMAVKPELKDTVRNAIRSTNLEAKSVTRSAAKVAEKVRRC